MFIQPVYVVKEYEPVPFDKAQDGLSFVEGVAEAGECPFCAILTAAKETETGQMSLFGKPA